MTNKRIKCHLAPAFSEKASEQEKLSSLYSQIWHFLPANGEILSENYVNFLLNMYFLRKDFVYADHSVFELWTLFNSSEVYIFKYDMNGTHKL